MELDTASKIFAMDNLFTITAYIDSSVKISETIEDKLDVILDTFPELKNRIVKTDTTVFMEPVVINLKDHYTIKKDSADNFHTITKIIESQPFQSDIQWIFYLLEDDEQKKYRL